MLHPLWIIRYFLPLLFKKFLLYMFLSNSCTLVCMCVLFTQAWCAKHTHFSVLSTHSPSVISCVYRDIASTPYLVCQPHHDCYSTTDDSTSGFVAPHCGEWNIDPKELIIILSIYGKRMWLISNSHLIKSKLYIDAMKCTYLLISSSSCNEVTSSP